LNLIHGAFKSARTREWGILKQENCRKIGFVHGCCVPFQRLDRERLGVRGNITATLGNSGLRIPSIRWRPCATTILIAISGSAKTNTFNLSFALPHRWKLFTDSHRQNALRHNPQYAKAAVSAHSSVAILEAHAKVSFPTPRVPPGRGTAEACGSTGELSRWRMMITASTCGLEMFRDQLQWTDDPVGWTDCLESLGSLRFELQWTGPPKWIVRQCQALACVKRRNNVAGRPRF
jgi:hypothetical protein